MTLPDILLPLAVAVLGFGLGWLIQSARAHARLTRISGEREASTARTEELRSQNEQLHAQVREQENLLRERGEAAARLQASLREQERARDETEKRMREQQQRMQRDFENLANRIFDDKSDRFRKQSREQIEQVLKPLRDGLGSFQKKMDDSFGRQSQERFSLKEEIGKLVTANQNITAEAKNLSDALRQDKAAQGIWGEITLETLLQRSGLHPGSDYVTQGAGMGLRDDATGARQKPDVIVNLPDNKHIIIDAKVSLKHYLEYCESADQEKMRALQKFGESIKAHVDGLADRGYSTSDTIHSPDFVLMFMPFEGALVLLASERPDMHLYAWDKKIVIAGPTTLLASLRTIASLWQLEKQNRHAEEIATLGGRLYDKIAGFVGNMQKVGEQLARAHNAHDQAMSQLHTGHGNILRQAERMKELGARTRKSLPAEWREDARTDPDEADDHLAGTTHRAGDG